MHFGYGLSWSSRFTWKKLCNKWTHQTHKIKIKPIFVPAILTRPEYTVEYFVSTQKKTGFKVHRFRCIPFAWNSSIWFRADECWKSKTKWFYWFLRFRLLIYYWNSLLLYPKSVYNLGHCWNFQMEMHTTIYTYTWIPIQSKPKLNKLCVFNDHHIKSHSFRH